MDPRRPHRYEARRASGLKWEDVDLDGRSVRIHRTLTRKGSDTGGSYGLGEPKTKNSRRTVKLTERAVEALRSHRARQAEKKLRAGASYQEEGLVFTGERGSIINTCSHMLPGMGGEAVTAIEAALSF